MTWTPERHAAARKRCEDATAGPWVAYEGFVRAGEDQLRGPKVADCDPDGGDYVGPEAIRNADLIARSRADLPDALDEIERLQAELAKFAPPAGMKHTMSLYQPDQP